MNPRSFVLFLVLCCGAMPALVAAATSSSRSIHIEWGYTPPSEPQVSGYRLYQEGVKACQTTVATATAMDCTVTLVKAVTNFTLTATFADGTESPHSAPFAFSLDEDTTQTPVATTPVTATPPTAVLATSVAAGTYPLKVSFDGSKSSAATGSTLASYQWQFGDNSSASGSSATHTYTQAGTFTATLTVTDSRGLKNSATTPIVVSKPATTSGTTTTTAKASTSTSTSASAGSTASTSTTTASPLRLEAGEIAVTSGWRKVSFANTYQQPIVIAGPVTMQDKAPVTVRIRNVTATGFEIRLIQWPYLRSAHRTETISYMVLEKGRHTLADGSRIEAGQMTGSLNSTTVSFQSSFNRTPVVLTTLTSCNDAGAIAGRVLPEDKTGLSYAFRVQEGNRLRRHSPETVHYVAWEPGTGLIGTARYEIAVTEQAITEAWKGVSMQSTFKQAPLLFADMQSVAELDPATLRVQQATTTEFQIMIHEEQSKDREMRHRAEKIGYLAIDPVSVGQ